MTNRYQLAMMRRGRELSTDQILKYAPAALAEKPSSDVSKNYNFLSTKKLLEVLEKKDILPYSVTQSSYRSEEKKECGKHMIRFRQKDFKVVNDLIPEIVLVTSHDAKSAFRFTLGMFRLVCSNGLVTPAGILDTIAIRHINACDNDVIDAAFEVLNKSNDAEKNICEMQKYDITQEQKYKFAQNAFNLRWDINDAPPISPATLLKHRRYEDNQNNLWHTFNVVQENIIKGGIRYYKIDEKGNSSRNMTRAVSSISKNIEINKKLWELANNILYTNA